MSDKASIDARYAAVKKRLGATTKGTAEAAKPGKWKLNKLNIDKDGKSFAVEFKKKL